MILRLCLVISSHQDAADLKIYPPLRKVKHPVPVDFPSSPKHFSACRLLRPQSTRARRCAARNDMRGRGPSAVLDEAGSPCTGTGAVCPCPRAEGACPPSTRVHPQSARVHPPSARACPYLTMIWAAQDCPVRLTNPNTPNLADACS